MITALCMLLSASLATAQTPGADALKAEMILREVAQHGATQLSETVNDPGQCRRFQADTFAAASEGFMLAEYPEATLFLPTEHADQEDTGRKAGACWDMPPAETGNAFVEAARYDYDRSLSKKENQALALSFLQNIRAGDLLQMFATYSSGGRGTHTILCTQPYDPRDDTLYWADSNFANRIVDGKRHGVVRAYQAWGAQEVADWLTADLQNGATLYRLREDITLREQ